MWKRLSSNAEPGFTLLEVLVALVMAVFVGMAVYAMHTSVMEAYDHVRKARRVEHGPRVLHDVLTDDLRSLYWSDDSNTDFYFIGTQAHASDDPFMSFATTDSLNFNDRDDDTDIKGVRYLLEKGSERGTFDLVREEKDHCGVDGDFDWTSVTIMQGITSLEPRYYDDLNTSFSDSWKSDPSQSNRPMRPGAVKLTIKRGDDEHDEVFLIKLPPIRYLLKR